MMITLECEDGTQHQVLVDRQNAPGTGESMDFEDEEGVLRRGIRVAKAPNTKVRNYRFESTQTPLWDPRAPHHTKIGRSAFETMKEVHEYQARVNDDNAKAGNGEKVHIE